MMLWNKPSSYNPVDSPKTNLENRFVINNKANNDLLSQPLIWNTTKNIKTATGSHKAVNIFYKGCEEKIVRLNLSILKGQVGFDKLSVKERTALVAKNSDGCIQEWYYNMKISDELPKTWKELKIYFLSFSLIK